MVLFGNQVNTLFFIVTSLISVHGNNDVNKQLEDGALKLKNEMDSLITKNLGYDILQVFQLNSCNNNVNDIANYLNTYYLILQL